jgi:hypothetical protein
MTSLKALEKMHNFEAPHIWLRKSFDLEINRLIFFVDFTSSKNSLEINLINVGQPPNARILSGTF